jgi:hypothetical protein
LGKQDLMPQDILKLREQVLEGEWNLENGNTGLEPASFHLLFKS